MPNLKMFLLVVKTLIKKHKAVSHEVKIKLLNILWLFKVKTIKIHFKQGVDMYCL